MAPQKEYAGGPAARYLLLGAALFLTVFGLVMVYSASSISALVKQGSPYFFAERQAVFVLFGIVLAWGVSRFDYRRFRGPLGYQVWGVAIFLLVTTWALGVVRGGARRWIPLGFFNLQPSEFAKIACVLVAAMLAVEWQRHRTDTPTYLRRLGIFVGIPAVLIVFQPDLGTTMLMAAGVAIVLFLGGIELRWVYVALAVLVVFAVFAIAIEPYRMARVTASLDPWSEAQGKGYQAVQALLAFGTGGIKGLGLGLSRQKWFYLPEAHTDFIFAMVGEEIGLVGTLSVIGAFVVVVFSGIRIAMGSRDQYGRLLAAALTGMLGFQAILNMAAVTGLFPVTGKPLPFMSYGGSSIVVTMISVGLILSVSEYGACAPKAIRTPSKKKEPVRASSDERRRDRGARVPRTDSRRPVRRRA
ncbi:MAG: putative lipid II flippase FtsW [Coriobacteriia bacterium]|nr:putative lipid II flippase FtsW [Coriobacteriia bacterium]